MLIYHEFLLTVRVQCPCQYLQPIKSRNWEVHLEFRVFGRGKDLFGDGLTFWYTRDTLRTGPVFGNEEFFSGLAVFLDTYANQNGPHGHQHPYVSAMVNNGSQKYDHDRDGTHTELAGCEAKFRGVDHPTYILIRYDNDVVTVQTDIEGKNEWKECFSVKGVRLPTGYHIGVTAATGDLSDNHDVISIKTFELEPTPGDTEDRSQIIPHATSSAPVRDHVHDPPARTSGLKIFFLVLLAIIVVVAAVIGGVWYYNEQQTKRGRFY